MAFALPLPFLIVSVEQYREQVRSILRLDSGNIVLGIIVVTVALAAAALYKIRARGKDPALLWFALFAALYGLRLLIKTRTVHFTTGIPQPFWDYFEAAITYVVPLPSAMVVYEIFPAWRRWLKPLIAIEAVSAGAGIVSDLLLRRPMSLQIVNNVLVVVFILIFQIVLFRIRDSTVELRSLRIGSLAFGVAAILGNIAGLLHWRFDPEPIGFAVFLAFLGRVIARRAVETQERLTVIEKELEIARRIQLSILPNEMPRTPYFKMAARYLPMTAVAGDFYDFLVLDQHRIGILIADVSGHGVPAALIASMVKVAVSAQMPHADDPARVLTGMNQTLCGKMQGQFVTAAYVFVDLTARKMRYAAAGHPPMLWLSGDDGKIEAIEENGLLLGLVPSAPYTSIERDITGGDRFLLYTDGLLEAANERDEFFGEDRIRQSLRSAARAPADQCAASLMTDLASWAGHDRGHSQDDDLTVVVIDLCEQNTSVAQF